MTFPILETLDSAVSKAFPQISTATDIQLESIKEILNPKNRSLDIIIKSPTGSGKSLAFLLPILHYLLTDFNSIISHSSSDPNADSNSIFHSRSVSNTPCLIISPTRELARQTLQMLQDILNKLTGKDHWIVAGHLTGGEKKKSEKARLRKGIHIVVGTPGRILDHLKSTQSWSDGIRNSIQWIILDEVDRLKDLGFEKVIGEILSFLIPPIQGKQGLKEKIQRPQIIMSSATASNNIKAIDKIQLKNLKLITATNKTDNDKLSIKGKSKGSKEKEEANKKEEKLRQQVIIPPTKLRTVLLCSILERFKKDKIVIFLLCCDSVEFFYEFFNNKFNQTEKNEEKEKEKNQSNEREKKIKMKENIGKREQSQSQEQDKNKKFINNEKRHFYHLHGSMEHSHRIDTINKFTKEKESAVLLCTDVAARGLNLIGVNTIIQFDAPCDSVDYIHRVGRTARQQEIGQSILFLMPSERAYIDRLKQMGIESIQEIPWKSFFDDNPYSHNFSSPSLNSSSINANINTNPTTKTASFDREADLEERRKKAKALEKNSKLNELGKKAFIGMVRGYATHPKNEKDIFHPKQLHLGHLATTFGLSEPPTELSGSLSKSKKIKTNQHQNQHHVDNDIRHQKQEHFDGIGKKRPREFSNNNESPLFISLGSLSRKRVNQCNEFGSGL